MTALAVDPTTTPGDRPVSLAAVSATALPEHRADRTWTLDIGNEPIPAWLPEVEARLNELLALAPGWDTYGAPALDPMHLVNAVSLLLRLAPSDAPAPWIAPTARRGVQLEWDLDGVEIEASVDDTGSYIFVTDPVGEDEGEVSNRPDLCERAARAIESVATAA